MRYLIPGTDQINSQLFRLIIEDWLDRYPEDVFYSTDPDVTYLLHEMFPSHVSDHLESGDVSWGGFWSGLLPGDSVSQNDDEAIYLEIVDGRAVLDDSALERILERLKQGLNLPTLTGSTPNA